MSLELIQGQNGNVGREADGLKRCIALKELMRWQAERYRMAVAENRWYMSEKLCRYVSWSEAELDFCRHNTYGCAEKWRLEYCGQECPLRAGCVLAAQFLNRDRSAAA